MSGIPTSPSSGPNANAACDDTIQSCPFKEEENWIELEYLYCDGTGVSGANYCVTDNDSGAIVAQGTLDANGYAWCALPEPVNNVFL